MSEKSNSESVFELEGNSKERKASRRKDELWPPLSALHSRVLQQNVCFTTECLFYNKTRLVKLGWAISVSASFKWVFQVSCYVLRLCVWRIEFGVSRFVFCAFRPDVEVITANPKTAGVARWNFLALWGHKMGKGDSAAQEFVTKVRLFLGLAAFARPRKFVLIPFWQFLNFPRWFFMRFLR